MNNQHQAPSDCLMNEHKEDELSALNNENKSGKPTRRQVLAGGAVTIAGVIASQLPSSAQRQEALSNEVGQTTPTGRLRGKVALITGAARGIGRAAALTLAREGADVIVTDLAKDISTVTYKLSSPADLAETERRVKALGRRCLAVQADVRDMARMREVVAQGIAQMGHIDIVVANAGVLSASPLATMTDQQWADNIDVDLTGAANTLRAAIPHLIERKQGRIIAISSDIGRRGGAGVAHYCAAKWGVIGLVKSAALELQQHNITVNAICPGLTRSGMSQNVSTYALFTPNDPTPTEAEVATAVRKMNIENGELPIAWLEAEDIANGILFLSSTEGRYITGTALDITAGKSANYTT